MAVTHVAYEVDDWGVGELWLDEADRVVWHELPRPAQTAPRGTHRAVELLRRYFGGEEVSFDGVLLDLDYETPFLDRCAHALREIPRGEVVTYGELAALAGRPNAQRAAGSVCANNRFPLVVPCHRVVSATGIGGYGASGVEVKRRLLRLEGVSL